MRCDLIVGLFLAGFDLADLQQHGAKSPFDRGAHFARLEREGSVRNGRIDNFGLRDRAKIGIRRTHATVLGDLVEGCAFGDTLARGRRIVSIRKDDLPQLALFRLAVAVLALLEIGFCVFIADRVRFCQVCRGECDEGDLAIFRRTEQRFPFLEIFIQFLRRRGGISPACAAPSATYSMRRFSF